MLNDLLCRGNFIRTGDESKNRDVR